MNIEDIKKEVAFAQRLMRLDGYACGVVDCIWGKKTEAAWQCWLRDALAHKQAIGALDTRSEGNLETLLPSCQKAIRAWFMGRVLPWAEQNGCVVKIICGTRSYREQDKLYQQGRTLPGKIVTKAKAGYSNHNFGIAFDLGVFVNGKYEEGDKLYRKLHADCGCPDGFLWGGNWRSMPDTPHYQLARFGDTTEKIRKVFIA